MANTDRLTYAQARSVVEQYAAKITKPLIENVALLEADGRVLAEDVFADRDFPPFARVTRDGFALRAADVTAVPARLQVVGEIAAGAAQGEGLKAGQAIEIMTGAPLPDGADAVVMVEYTRREEEFVTVERAVRCGDNFVPQGAEARAGARLLPDGSRINPSAIAIAASVGKASLHVYHRPVVAILSTGDELVDIHETPGTAEIRNSNSYSIAAQVRRHGGEALILPIARDREGSIREAVHAAKSADLLILSGGVSMGKYDLVEQVLAAEGATFAITGALIQPGKPVVFGTMPREEGELPLFGLPGNPVSTMVCFDLFVTPVLAALGGATGSTLRFAQAQLSHEFKTSPGLTRFLPALLTGDVGKAEVAVVPWQGSGDLAAVAKANCYLVVPPEAEVVPRGSWISVLLKD